MYLGGYIRRCLKQRVKKSNKGEFVMKVKTKNEISASIKPITTAIDQLGQALLPVLWGFKDIFGSLYSSQKQIAFQDFVEGIAYHFENQSLDEASIKALTQKISDSQNYETMTIILDSVFFSHCKLSRTILGIITGKYMLNNAIDYENMVLVNALKDVFDDDLNEFWRYSQYSPHSAQDRTSFMEHYSEKDRLIVEKLQNTGILGRDLAGNRLSGSEYLRFELTNVSKRLKNYLQVIRPDIIQ